MIHLCEKEDSKEKHPQIRENDGDGPLSKVLESRGIRRHGSFSLSIKSPGLDGFRTFESNLSKVPL